MTINKIVTTAIIVSVPALFLMGPTPSPKQDTIYVSIVNDTESRVVKSNNPRGEFFEAGWHCRWAPNSADTKTDYWFACTGGGKKVKVAAVKCGKDSKAILLGDSYISCSCY